MALKKWIFSLLFLVFSSTIIFSQSSISGTVHCLLGNEMDGVEVVLSGGVMAPQTVYTDEAGQYAFIDLPEGLSYTITFAKEGIITNGLTTFDILKIKQHILGIDLFYSVFQDLAADVNLSGTITTLDLVEIMKVILLIDTEFPNGNNGVWHFGNENLILSPADIPVLDDLPISNLQEDVELNVIGFHTGDVTGSDCY